jgi:hypothetical protein
MLCMLALWSSYYRDEPRIVSPNNSIKRRLKPRLEIAIVPVFLIARSLAGGLVAAAADQKPLSDLERQAEEVLSEPDNVARRARIAPVPRVPGPTSTA